MDSWPRLRPAGPREPTTRTTAGLDHRSSMTARCAAADTITRAFPTSRPHSPTRGGRQALTSSGWPSHPFLDLPNLRQAEMVACQNPRISGSRKYGRTTAPPASRSLFTTSRWRIVADTTPPCRPGMSATTGRTTSSTTDVDQRGAGRSPPGPAHLLVLQRRSHHRLSRSAPGPGPADTCQVPPPRGTPATEPRPDGV